MGRGFIEAQRARFHAECMEDLRVGKTRMTELLGVCQGIMADGVVNAAELEYLVEWFEKHKEAVDQWPANVLVNRLAMILADDIIEPHELDDLAKLLRDLEHQRENPDFGARTAARHILTNPAPDIAFPGRHFVFTGEFLCDTRRACEQAAVDRGAVVKNTVSRKTNYVVIGTIAAPEWVHGNYGTKVERALQLRQRGYAVAVVAEEHWARHL